MAKKSFEEVIPSKTLEESIRVGRAMVDSNAGKAIDKLTLAQLMGLSPTSSTFIQLVSSSQMYGLTSGSAFSSSISITDLGRNYFYPRSNDEEKQALFKAANYPPLIKKIYIHFNENKLPPFENAKNILLRNFGIKEDKAKNAWDIIRKNATFVGFLQIINGVEWINLNKIQQIKSEEEDEEFLEELQNFPEIEESKEEILEVPIQTKPKVFISHSKNKKIVEQIKKILDFGQFDYVIAEEKETTAIPIAEKVFGSMNECNCAIINLSVDEAEETLNQNVLIEIGAAFLKYNKKVILLVDKRFSSKIPSNLSGLYRCEYEGDELSFDTALKLQQALIEFRNF